MVGFCCLQFGLTLLDHSCIRIAHPQLCTLDYPLSVHSRTFSSDVIDAKRLSLPLLYLLLRLFSLCLVVLQVGGGGVEWTELSADHRGV